jgi:hypothetical protein
MIAKYPGRCVCGAQFERGTKIAWSVDLRRATECPACYRPRKAGRVGATVEVASGVAGGFHGVDGAVIAFTAQSFDGSERYEIRNGQWTLARYGREPALARRLTHAEIEGYRAAAGV